ncbi:uncharacterized protein LOC132259596 [Phlebotomus argentipes]|uniref:uncharacterized protein LOC132259596 n=1 Tax=Phlebotomus argentipes TaxID=94469 RepID=UPI002892DAFC|nr:uncharacterized protein LOC132259596 [Phlebotomus argentipes]
MYFPLQGYLYGEQSGTREGRRCHFYLPDYAHSHFSVTFALVRMSDHSHGPLVSYVMTMEDVLRKILKSLEDRRILTEGKSISDHDCLPYNHKNINCTEVVKRLVPLLNQEGRAVAFLVIVMSFTAKGSAVVKHFSVKNSREFSDNSSDCCYESSSYSSSKCESESLKGLDLESLWRSRGCKSLTHVDSPSSTSLPLKQSETIRKVSCPFISPKGRLRKVSNYSGLSRIRDNAEYTDFDVSQCQKATQKVTTQIPDELLVKFHGEAFCPLTACKSIELTWKLPKISPKSLRTTETQVHNSSLQDLPLVSAEESSEEPQKPKNKKKKKGKKTGRKARKQTGKDRKKET